MASTTETHPSATARVSNKTIGRFLYRTSADGSVQIFDAKTADVISIASMQREERVAFFSELAETLEAGLPKNAVVTRSRTIVRILFDPPETVLNPVKAIHKLRGWMMDFFEGLEYPGTIGVIRGHVGKRNDMRIPWMRSEVKGGGTLLLAELLKQHPKIGLLYGELAHTNRRVYDQHILRGAPHALALRGTPLYKAFATCGFTRVEMKKLTGSYGGPLLVATPEEKVH